MSIEIYFLFGAPTFVAFLVLWAFGKRSALFYLSGILCVAVTAAILVFYDDNVRTKAFQEAESARAFEEEVNHVTEDDFFAFIGEIVTATNIPESSTEGRIIFYDQFEVTFRVVQQVWGNYEDSLISFSVNDHYGRPPLVDSKWSMLFVSKSDNVWTHELYQWFPVHPTIDGRWAYCGDPTPTDWQGTPINLSEVEFEPKVYFNTQNYTEEGAKRLYPEPIWSHRSGEAYCTVGAYPDELFRVKQEGILKNRGLF